MGGGETCNAGRGNCGGGCVDAWVTGGF